MYEELGQVVEDQSYSDEKATSALLREAERNNMSFLIVDRATGNKYTNVHNEDLLLNQLAGICDQSGAEKRENAGEYGSISDAAGAGPLERDGIPGDVGKF